MYSTKHYTITSKGLRISKKMIWKNEAVRIISYEKLENIRIKMTFNKSMFYYGIGLFLIGAFNFFINIAFYQEFSDNAIILSFMSMPFFFTVCFTIRTSLFINDSDEKLLSILPFGSRKKKFQLFFKTLEKTRDDILGYRHYYDEIYGTDYEKKYIQLLDNYNSGEIDLNKFMWGKRFLFYESSPDPRRDGTFLN